MLARRALLATVAVGLVACATACSDGNDDGPFTLPTVNESAAVPTDQSAMPRPDSVGSVSADKRASAESFARTWHEEFNRAQLTGDFSRVEQLSSPSCSLCAEEIANVKRFLEQGQQIRGGQFKILSVYVAAYSPPSALVEITSITSAAEVVDESGSVVQAFEATPSGTVLMNLLEQNDSWIVQDMIRN